MVSIQSRNDYLKPDAAIKSLKADWKVAGFAGAFVAVTVTMGNVGVPKPSLDSAFMYQNVDIAKTPGSGWTTRAIEKPSQALFDDLTYSNPQRLISMIKEDNLEPPLLTFAAESLGKITQGDLMKETITTLLSLTNHPSSLVREGAIYGLASFSDTPFVLTRLKEIQVSDTSEGVRLATEDVL